MVVEKIGKDIGIGFKTAKGIIRKVIDCVKWGITFVMINVSWVFFRAVSIEEAFVYLTRIFAGGWKCQEGIIETFDKLIEIRLLKRLGFAGLLDNYTNVAIWGIMLLLVIGVVFLQNTQEKMKTVKYNRVRSVITAILMIWCVISLSDVSEFLYFEF